MASTPYIQCEGCGLLVLLNCHVVVAAAEAATFTAAHRDHGRLVVTTLPPEWTAGPSAR